MVFDIRPLKNGDYENILLHWWKSWGFAPPSKDFLPEDGRGGFIIYDKDIPVCAGFIYITNSKVAWVDWIVSNKDYRKKPHRKEALLLLIDTLTNMCKNTGAKYSYALIKHKSLIGTYEKLGYTAGDSYTQEMIKNI
tara:strand:+ start:882 stop:1292 length:411 start_codon:yes stop_codon:yes gene_type:complete